jgi:protein phosphatase 4 regulatory subunit 3
MRHRGTMIDEFDVSPGGGSPYDELGHMGHGVLHAPPIELPLPALDTLGTIARALSEASLFQRETLANQMLSPGFIPRLLAAFKTAEDLEDEETLSAAHAVVKAAILINDTALLETLLSDEFAIDVIGALEYDPEIPVVERPRHRDHLAGPGALREIIPIKDPLLRSKIIQAHRMGYVKDVVLPRALDDATFASLSSLQMFNQVEVLVALQTDSEFFPELFTALRNSDPNDDEWADLVGYLQELVGLARHVQASQRNALLAKLVDLGLFPVLASVLKAGDTAAKLRAADVLLASVAHDPAPLRAYLQGEGTELFSAMVDAIHDSNTAGLQEQCLEILKVLIDPDTMDGSVEKDAFIDIFYERHVGRLLQTVVAAGDPKTPAHPGTLVLLLDLLCYCVQHHSYRIKYYILRSNVVEKVLKLMKRKERAVAAAALRFLRTCLSMKDEFYNRYLVKNSLLEPVLSSFLGNGRRYNLLNSAVLELLEFLRRENMKGLIAAVVNSPQWPRLEEDCDYVDTFQRLKLRHESNLETRAAPPGSVGGVDGSGNGSGGMIGPQPLLSSGGGGMIAQQPNTNYITAADHSHLVQQRESAAASAAATAARAAAAAEARQRRGEKEEDADEENYFREDDDDDDDSDVDATAHEPSQHPALQRQGVDGNGGSRGGGAVPGQIVLESFSPLPGMLAGRLVDYEDDDDDDDTLPLGVLSRAGAGGGGANTTTAAAAAAAAPVVAPSPALPPINTSGATTIGAGVLASTAQPRPRLGEPQRLETPKRSAEEQPADAPPPEKKPKGGEEANE